MHISTSDFTVTLLTLILGQGKIIVNTELRIMGEGSGIPTEECWALFHNKKARSFEGVIRVGGGGS